MSKFLFPMIVILFMLVSCDQPSHSSRTNGLTGLRYSYDIPDNVYEYCGEQKRADEFLGFEMYCFNDFRAMGLCTFGENNQHKEYSDCNYDAHFSVQIEWIQTDDSPKALLENLITENHPSAIISYTSVGRNVSDAIVAEISSEKVEMSPALLTIIRTGQDTIITIKGNASDPNEIQKVRKAFEVIASSISAGHTPIVSTRVPKN